DRGLDDLLRRLMETGVHDLHSRVAEGAGDDLRPTVMAVETGLRNDHADLSLHLRSVYEGEIARRGLLARVAEPRRRSVGLPRGGGLEAAPPRLRPRRSGPTPAARRERLAARGRGCRHALAPRPLG